jgi:hypothetical protein
MTGEKIMEKKYGKDCKKVVNNEKQVISCLQKTKYANFIDNSHTNATI